VGAVALDTMGNVAFGTSTGGITAKKPGRVGDSPIIGLFVNIIVFLYNSMVSLPKT
jgi:isoaspartyl peptidase/L-asparaginase-like protein (Ntn-hydrolase superfamily)